MKTWYFSKTIWTNLIASVALFLQNQYGYVLPPEMQAYALIVINLILRTITKEGLKS